MNEEDEYILENIESILLHGVAKGEIDLKGIKNGEGTYGITQKGEERVAEMAGGKDVLEASSKMLKILHEYGAMGFPVEAGISNFVLITMLLKIFKNYKDWDTFMKKIPD